MPLQHLWKEAFSDVRRWAGNVHLHSLLLDFDGTLAPVLPDPETVFLDSTVRRILKEIQETGRIAIGVISGRSLDEIKGRIGVCEIIYAGNHGMEIMGPGVRFIDRAALAARDEIQLLALRFKYELKGIPNVQIRNKGLSITIHWSTPQLPEDQQEIRSVVIDAVADGSGRFTVRDAINSIDILPSTNWNKGSAAVWINKHLGVDALRIERPVEQRPDLAVVGIARRAGRWLDGDHLRRDEHGRSHRGFLAAPGDERHEHQRRGDDRVLHRMSTKRPTWWPMLESTVKR